jgi:uncharacterized protein (TIGR03067 family)
LAFAPAPLPKPPPPDPNKADLKAMQGKWTRTLLIVDGRTTRKLRGAEVTATIKGDRMVYSARDVWELTLDAKASPKRIDSKGAVPNVGNYLFLGVYRLEGDKLTICCREAQGGKGKRPADFDPAQRGVWLQVFERIK